MRRAKRWRPPLVRSVVRELLVRLGDHRLFFVHGLHDPYRAIDHREFMRRLPWATDYVNHAATQLICREIIARGVRGAVAELGVAKGDWARSANRWLPDRDIHLFDTFEGFDARDLVSEAAAGLSHDAPYPMDPTPLSDLLEVLPHPERARVHAGWFPQSTVGLADEQYALVHIDVGLRSVTRAGLEYFRPRLAPGGTIIVTDYNNRHAPGVRVALDEHLMSHPAATTVWPSRGGALLIIEPAAATAAATTTDDG